MNTTTEAEILSRVIEPDKPGLSKETAKAFLELKLSKMDQERIHELLVKNQEGSITMNEEEELETYRRVGYFLDLLRTKARKSLKQLENNE